MRALALLAAISLIPAGAQTAAPLAFEVATIKQSPPMEPAKMMSGQIRVGMKLDGARAEFSFLSLADLICAAYKVKSFQLSGPDWMKTVRWDVQATIPEGATKEQVPEMLQSLLKDRFKLQVHKDNKDHNIYALVQGKGGHKLKEAEPDAPAPPPEAEAPAPKEDPKDAKGPGPQGGSMTVNGEKMTFKRSGDGMVMKGGEMGQIKTTMTNGMLRMEMSKVGMPAFAEMLTRFVDRPVNDETQLKGKYQVALEMSMGDMMNMARQAGVNPMGGPGGGPGGAGAPGAGAPGGPRPADSASDPGGSSSIFTAVEQMGLKLMPKKGPVEMIVVDHLEKAPTEN